MEETINMENPIPKPTHDRGVSWEAAVKAGAVEDVKAGVANEDQDTVPIPPHLVPPKPKPNPKSQWANLKVKDILKSSPAEDLAETYLQRQLEEKDNHNDANDSDDDDDDEIDNVEQVLSGIPEEHLDNFAKAASQRSLSSKSTNRSSKNKKKKRSKGGEKLFDMVSLLMDDQKGRYSAEAMQNQGVLVTDEDSDDDYDAQQLHDEAIPTTASDQLARNAANIFLRKSKATNKSHMKLATVNEDNDKKKTDDDDNQDLEAGGQRNQPEGSNTSNGKTMEKNIMRRAGRMKSRVSGDFHDFVDFATSQKSLLWTRVRNALLFIILPCTGAAFLCFYLLGNPPCGTARECADAGDKIDRDPFNNGTIVEIAYVDDPDQQAAISWWFLFIGVRLVITCGLALVIQAFIVDFCCLMTSICLRLCGSFITLFLVQAKGWPFILLLWGVLNFAVNYGDSDFVKHWLFWQDYVGLFNAENQAGQVLTHNFYRGLLINMIVIGGSVAVKRYVIGLWLGRRTYHRYAADLGKVMEKAVLIRAVAHLSRNKIGKHQIEKNSTTQIHQIIEDTSALEDQSTASKSKEGAFTGAYLSGSAQIRINDLLGEFEEPDMFEEERVHIAISDIIRFRQSVAFLNTPTPFSGAFGRADGRETCITNSQRVYERLNKYEGGDILHFNILAKLCDEDDDDDLDEEMLRKLIKLFRPERDGSLAKLDFVKSVDTVYKDIRLLRAGIANSQRVDRSSESIFHIGFYFVLGCLCLAILGINPVALFLAISGFIVGFAFMIGPAASKIFEGILLVLVRKPYEIGDKINVSNVTTDTPGDGSAGWLVKDVDLFTTTVSYWNGELATYSNGSLAAHRIINMNRSDSAFQYFAVKFPSDTNYSKILLFRKCVETFVKDRPREWMAFNGFRVTRVEIEQGFVEYKVMMTHREKWQNLGAIKESTAEVQTFCRELCKKMDIEYQAPSMPIDLHFAGGSGKGQGSSGHSKSQPSMSSVDAADLMARVHTDTEAAGFDSASEVSGLEAIQKMFAK